MTQRIVKRPPVSSETVMLTPQPFARAKKPSPHEPGVGSPGEEERQAAEQQAAEVLARAREEAQAGLEATRQEAERLREEAQRAGREEGYQQGYAEGRATGQREAESAVQEAAEATIGEHLRQLGALVARAQVDRIALICDVESDLVQLALAIAEKVLHQRLANDERAAVLDITRDALERLAAVSAEGARVRVHPSDYEAFRDVWDALELEGTGGVSCQVTPDERVEPGGCLVESRAARIDGQWSTQLAQVRAALTGAVAERPAASAAETR